MILSAINKLKSNNGYKNFSVKVFNEKSEEKILLFLSEQLEDSDFVKKYHAGKIKCDACGHHLEPNGTGTFALGGVIPTDEGPKLICQTMECFEKYI